MDGADFESGFRRAVEDGVDPRLLDRDGRGVTFAPGAFAEPGGIRHQRFAVAPEVAARLRRDQGAKLGDRTGGRPRSERT